MPLLALCQQLPEMMALFARSQSVAFECLAPVVGLRLPGCSVQRSDQFEYGFAGRGILLPSDLLVTVRQEGNAVRLAGLYNAAVVP